MPLRATGCMDTLLVQENLLEYVLLRPLEGCELIKLMQPVCQSSMTCLPVQCKMQITFSNKKGILLK